VIQNGHILNIERETFERGIILIIDKESLILRGTDLFYVDSKNYYSALSKYYEPVILPRMSEPVVLKL